ncbi:MAG: NUDIX pyrophosphatase [Ignavibacteriales bacterium]|nr:NUDIX pyrophosphatase [Ignavibacteriales bacterium]
MNVISALVEAHIFRKIGNDLEFLLLKRASNEKYADVWQMVTGSIESESAYQTALREIKEETGLTPIKFWVVPNINSFYSTENDIIIMIPVFAAMVDENAVVTISEEHTEFKWVKKEEAIKLLAWPGQRKSVGIIYEYFTNRQSIIKFVEIEL